MSLILLSDRIEGPLLNVRVQYVYSYLRSCFFVFEFFLTKNINFQKKQDK